VCFHDAKYVLSIGAKPYVVLCFLDLMLVVTADMSLSGPSCREQL